LLGIAPSTYEAPLTALGVNADSQRGEKGVPLFFLIMSRDSDGSSR
jgi:hypothetical protein